MPTINPITIPLPADLPTNWQPLETVPNAGPLLGRPEQYGYNYLMEQVNAAQQALVQVGEYIPQLALDAEIGGYILMLHPLPLQSRRPNTLYGLVLDDFSAQAQTEGGAEP